MTQDEILAYYLAQGPMTDPHEYAPLFESLPADPAGLVRIIQGLMVHIFWAGAYNLKLSEQREREVMIRPARRKIERIIELDPAPLDSARPYEQKLVGNCRDFTVMTVSMLRAKGIPARSRCGFGTYFIPGHYEDHWVLEYWDAPSGRWVWLDPQLDDLMRDRLKLPFNSLDMPAGAFVTGGEAWLMARRGEADPDCFGIFEFKGMDFIKGNLLRDLNALAKFEILPWDSFGIIETPAAQMNADELAQLDELAEICSAGDTSAALAFLTANPGFAAPAGWAD